MLDQTIIWPSEGDYLKQAQALRIQSGEALTPIVRDQLLLAALEWERLAAAVACRAEELYCSGREGAA